MPRFASAVVVVLGLVGALTFAQGPRFVPVTDAVLQDPDPADWINWRRTLDGWGYSPLKQVTTGNASMLGLVWSRVVTPGVGETTPLVYKGTMYLTKPMDEKGSGGVLALDAVSGELKWEYRKALEAKPAFDGRMRSLAIYKDRIFLNTPDAHIVALDARTGSVAWDVMVADYKLGYRYTSGPLVVNGRIVSGMTGCDRFKNDVCFISAHDPDTGRQVWRTSTIARPGEPAGETWGDLPLTFRAGGDAWIPGSFDPKTNLIYWSVAQAKPWARVSRGTDGDALFTNSLLAIDPNTGRIVWYHQFLPGETHDMDEVFENILVDRGERKSVFKMGKLGILWELDRTTGRYIGARDLGYQTIVDVNPSTGRVTYRPGMVPQDGVPIDFCPGLGGVKTWRAMSYHPETRALYIPISLGCQQSIFRSVEKVEGGGGNSVRPFAGEETVKSYPHPESPNARGQLIAMDTVTGGILWSHPTRRGPTTATLTTAGGLVFVGDGDGDFSAHDVKTGKIVFQTRLPFVGSGFPITYQVAGRQYVTFPAGSNGPGISVFALGAGK